MTCKGFILANYASPQREPTENLFPSRLSVNGPSLGITAKMWANQWKWAMGWAHGSVVPPELVNGF